jgi:hypothetical protein
MADAYLFDATVQINLQIKHPCVTNGHTQQYLRLDRRQFHKGGGE